MRITGQFDFLDLNYFISILTNNYITVFKFLNYLKELHNFIQSLTLLSTLILVMLL